MSKNCIAVGASLSYQDSYSSTTSMPVYTATLSVEIGGVQGYSMGFRVAQATFAGQLSSLAGARLQMVAANPQGAWSILQHF